MISIIIHIYQDVPQRRLNLDFLLKRYRNHELIVIEEKSDEPPVQVPDYVKYSLLEREGWYNRPKAFNKAIKFATTDRFVFLDVDCFFEHDIESVCRAAPVVMPRAHWQWLDQFESRLVRQGEWAKGYTSIEGYSSDGCISVSRDAYIPWPEEFAGWGAESLAMAYIYMKLRDCRLNNSFLCHLHHNRGKHNVVGSEQHIFNENKLSELKLLSNSKLRAKYL